MDLQDIQKRIDADLGAIKTDADCGTFHQRYLSKSGEVTALLGQLRDIEPSRRAEMGAALNNLKKSTEERLFTLQRQIKEAEFKARLMKDKLIDITIPDINARQGTLHPITVITREVEEVFAGMGFIIEDGPEIATEYENFESVNIPKNHPARDMQDTFWLERQEGAASVLRKKSAEPLLKQNASVSDLLVLRTHTSAWQNHMLKKYGPTFRAICPGRTFRNENIDATHDTTFFQVEGMMVGEDISIANLIYFMKEALAAVFKKDIKVRLRPSYYPFVEPGFDLDASCIFCDARGCTVCKHTSWIEFCGCGMIHPYVLQQGGIDPKKYQGFAFGFGLTRLAMMRYGLDDCRILNSGNLEFLKGVPQK